MQETKKPALQGNRRGEPGTDFSLSQMHDLGAHDTITSVFFCHKPVLLKVRVGEEGSRMAKMRMSCPSFSSSSLPHGTYHAAHPHLPHKLQTKMGNANVISEGLGPTKYYF